MAKAASFLNLDNHNNFAELVLNPLPAQQKLPAMRPCRIIGCPCGGGVGMCSALPENSRARGVFRRGGAAPSTGEPLAQALADNIWQETEILRQQRDYPDFTKELDPLAPMRFPANEACMEDHAEQMFTSRQPQVDAKEGVAKLFYEIEVRRKSQIRRYDGPRSQLFTATSKTLGQVEPTGPVRKPRKGELSFQYNGSVTLTKANTFMGDLTPLIRVWTALCSGTATNMRDGQEQKGKKRKKFLFPWGPCPGVDSGMLRLHHLPAGAFSLLTKFTPGAEYLDSVVVAHAKKSTSSPEGLEPDVKVGEYFKETFSEIQYCTTGSTGSTGSTSTWERTTLKLTRRNIKWEMPKPERLTGLTRDKVDKLTKDELRFELGSRGMSFQGTPKILKERLKPAVVKAPTVLVTRRVNEVTLGAGRITIAAWYPNACPRATCDHVGMLSDVQDIRTLDNVSKGENSRRPAAGQRTASAAKKRKTS